jgi:hypothetical protein
MKAAEQTFEILCAPGESEVAKTGAQLGADQWKMELQECEKTVFEQAVAAEQLLQKGQDPNLAYKGSSGGKKGKSESVGKPIDSGTETLLNSTYQALWKKLSSQQRLKLRDEERAWIKEREKLKNDAPAFLKATEDRIEALKVYQPSP